LLAPHDGRVRCGHCQEIFDAAHYQFDRDETVMAALAATTPHYGAGPGEPWSEKSSAEVSGGKRDARGMALHRSSPIPPRTSSQADRTRQRARNRALQVAAAEAEAVSRTRAPSDFPGEGHAGSPRQAVNRAKLKH